MRIEMGQPTAQPFRTHGAAHQPLAQREGGLRPALLVANAHLAALGVGQQRQVHGAGQCATREFGRCPHVDERRAVQEERGVIRGEPAQGAREPTGL